MQLINASPSNKQTILGTALWGWGITRSEAFNLLDHFIDSGGRLVDTATNYPINQREEDFGLAIQWLQEWIRLHPNEDISIIAKIGSKNNMGGPEFDLSPTTILATTNKLRDVLGNALSCISIHWDNRVDETQDKLAISHTVDAMSSVHAMGLAIGLSGIKNPQLYYHANPLLAHQWVIQVKENFTQHASTSYQPYFPAAKYFAYGINMGGIKLDTYAKNSAIHLRGIQSNTQLEDQLRRLLAMGANLVPSPHNLNHLSLAYTYRNALLSGVIIGPRNTKQLDETMTFWSQLEHAGNQRAWTELFSHFTKMDQ